MDPQIQTSNGIYMLEVMREKICPLEENTQTVFDPRYVPSSAFFTTEYAVQQENTVLNRLMNLPGFFKADNVPNPMIKDTVPLTAWTRSTFSWDL